MNDGANYETVNASDDDYRRIDDPPGILIGQVRERHDSDDSHVENYDINSIRNKPNKGTSIKCVRASNFSDRVKPIFHIQKWR